MNTIGDIGQPQTDAKCFRCQRYNLILGIVGAVFATAMGIGSVVAALWNIDGSFRQPMLAALILGTLWWVFTLLGVWIIAAYLRERLYLGKTVISQQGIFRFRTFEWNDVTQVNWRIWPAGGSVVVRTHTDKITIDLGNFTKAESKELIRFLHETLAEEIQENWPRFEQIAYRPVPPIRRGSRRDAILTAAIFFCFAGIFVYCWFAGLGTRYLVIGTANVIVAIWYLVRSCFVNSHPVPRQSESQDSEGTNAIVE